MALIAEKDVLLIIRNFESTSSKVVFQSLIDVKRKILATSNGAELFIENNGIKYLLRFLRTSNDKFLDLTLSILGNLCLDKHACEEVTSSPTVIPLLIGLLSIFEKDSVAGRTCRLIGNLAIWPSIAIKLHEEGVVIRLTNVLKSDKSSTATKHMAVRSLRILWNSHDFRKDMIRDKVVRAVTALLTTSTDELLQATLKALASFTCPYSEECALEVSSEGDGFTHLVTAITRCSKPELAIKVLLNLSLGQTIRHLLGSAGAVQAAIQYIGDKNPQQYPRDAVLLLCSLCREAANRSKMRLNGGLKILLHSVREGPSPSTQVRALETLLCFIYDEASLEILLEEGLVTTLIEKLGKVVKDHGKGHELLDASPSKRCRSQSPPNTCKLARSNSLRGPWDNSDNPSSWPRYSSSLSGNSPESMLSFSPDSSSHFRLSPGDIRSPQASPHSDAYSPVYSSDGLSDGEDFSEMETVSPLCIETVQPSRQISDSGDEASPVDTATNISQRPLESCSLMMLSRISHMDQPVKELADTDTIDALIRYTSTMDKPLTRSSRILNRLTRNEFYLMPLLLNGFVFKVNSNLVNGVHESCTRCLELTLFGQSLITQMSVIAETPFGEGELAHQLLCGNRPTRVRVILCIPYVVRNQRILRNLLGHSFCGLSALDLLMQLLKDELSDGLRDEAIDSVCRLARHLGVTAKPVQQISSKIYELDAHPLEGLSEDEIVEFVTDDGQKVSAERKLLCDESDVFSAMLEGSFRESGQLNVRLKDISAASLSALVRLIERPDDYRCLNNDVSIAFDVLELADRYLMSRVSVSVVRWILSRIKPKILPFLYMRAVNLQDRLAEGKNIVNDVLCYALAGHFVRHVRLSVFTEILISSYQEAFIEDVRQVIHLKLARK